MLVLAGSFTILRSGEGLTSFDKNNCVNFSGEKKENEGFPGNLGALRDIQKTAARETSVFRIPVKSFKFKFCPRSHCRNRIHLIVSSIF